MTIYQLIVLLISLYFIFDRLKKRLQSKPSQSLLKVMATLIMWGAVITITFVPHVFDGLIKKAGFEDNGNSLISLVLVFSLILFFKILSIIERIENNITEIVRKEALKDFEKKS